MPLLRDQSPIVPAGHRVYAALSDTPAMLAKWPRFRESLAAGVLLPERTAPLAPPEYHRNQFRTPTCVGFGVGCAAAIYARQELGWSTLWSPLALFTLAKEWARQDVRNTLEGTYSTAAWAVLQSLGLCAEGDWPLNCDPVSGLPLDPEWYKPPTVGAFASMGQHLLPHRLGSSAECRAWMGAAGRPFSFIMPVNASFEELGDEEVWQGITAESPSLGQHCQCADYYTPEGVVPVSSWDAVRRVIPWSYFDDGTCTDMIGPLHA